MHLIRTFKIQIISKQIIEFSAKYEIDNDPWAYDRPARVPAAPARLRPFFFKMKLVPMKMLDATASISPFTLSDAPISLSLSEYWKKKKTEIRSRPVIRWGRAWNFPAKKARANENCTSVSVCNANERVWNRSHGERERSEMTIKAFSTKLNEAKTLTEWEFVFVVLSEVSHSSTGRRRGFLCRGVFSSSYTGSPHRWSVMTWEIFHVLGYTWTWFLQNKY